MSPFRIISHLPAWEIPLLSTLSFLKAALFTANVRITSVECVHAVAYAIVQKPSVECAPSWVIYVHFLIKLVA